MDGDTYASAVGNFLRDYRQAHGITLESVARVGREYGATWSVSSVQAIEGGKAAPTLPTLLTLALSLGRLSGVPLRLADLFRSADLLDRPYMLTANRPVRRSWVDRILSGAPVVLTGADCEEPVASGEEAWDDELELEALARSDEMPPGGRRHDHVDALWEAMNEPPNPSVRPRAGGARVSLAESRAAKKLGVQPLELQRRAIRLWGRSLEAEAQHRAGAESAPQARGRVTRLLVEEIRESLESET